MGRMLVGIIAVLIGLTPVFATVDNDYTGCEWYPGHLMVNFEPSVGPLHDMESAGATVSLGIASLDELFNRYKVTRMTRIVSDDILNELDFPPDFYHFMLLECPPATDIMRMMGEFSKDPNVQYAEPNLLRQTCDIFPNDGLWNNQWDKRLMNCPRVWEFSVGSRDILACAVDVGVRWQHEDFFDNLWVNPGEDTDGDQLPYSDNTYPGDNDDLNGIDDDGNGKIDDFIAWDFMRNVGGCAPGEDCDSQEDNDPTSIDNHGTHVLGIIGAVGNNSIGVAGGCWNVRIMCCRAGYVDNAGDGRLPESATIPAILWAAAHGANIINMSYGGPGYNAASANACLTAWESGVLLVAAAGNDHISSPHYPSAYPHVISVGSVDSDDGVSDFSNYGTTVDCFAPGNPIMSTSINPVYESLSGTSMASPNAAGLFALMWSMFPYMTNQELEDLVLNNCVDITAINPGYNPAHLGHGRVDGKLAIASMLPYLTLDTVEVVNDNNNRLEPGETGGLVLTIANEEGWTTAFNGQIVVTTDDPYLTISNGTVSVGFVNPGGTASNAGNPVQITVSGAVPHAYWATFNVSLSDGGDYPRSETFQVRIGRPQTLIVADDGADLYYQFFSDGLWSDNSGYNHDVWNSHLDGDPTPTDLGYYSYVVWVCGNEGTNTLTADNQTMLANYLNSGGNLLLAGQNIDEDISGTTFYSDYLHCQSDGSAGSQRQLNGVASDPISGGTSLLLVGACGGNGLVGPSKITPINGGVGFYDYTQGGTGAVHFENDIYKVAYFAFAIEAACGVGGTTHYSIVLRNVMSWFGANVVAIDDEPRTRVGVPTGFALKQNYPNPFNPTTTLAFDLPLTTKVQLRVFDIQGRQVAMLIDGSMTAGSHTVNFDGSRLASGIYLAQLQAGDFTATQRMVLLK